MQIDTERIKQQIDLRELAAKYTSLKGRGNSRAGSCPKHCPPNDGGNNRLVVYRDKFICRHCHPAYGDCFEFAGWLMGFELHTRAGFESAADWLTNDNPPMLTAPAPPPLWPMLKSNSGNRQAAPGWIICLGGD